MTYPESPPSLVSLEGGKLSIATVSKEVTTRVAELEREATRMRFLHQLFLVLTILLGVAAPALVTYTPPTSINDVWWKIVVIFVTAIATAASTIRTVLRFNERYSNAALTSLYLLELNAQIQSRTQQILNEVNEIFVDQQLYETSAWARGTFVAIVKRYVEKEVSAMNQERINYEKLPPIKTADQSPETPNKPKTRSNRDEQKS